MIIDFTTRKRLDAATPAFVEVIDSGETKQVLLDGVVPRELAQKIAKLVDQYNADR